MSIKRIWTIALTLFRRQRDNSHFVIIFAAMFILGVSFGACGAGIVTTGSQGEIISQGMTPFSETWDQMLKRDMELRAAARTQSLLPEINIAPLPEEPRFPVNMPKGAGLEYLLKQNIYPLPGPSAPQDINTSFITTNMQDQFNDFGKAWLPPDTMGAVGPNHFMVVINGSVTIYSKSGTPSPSVSLDTFFTFTDGGTTYPRNGAFDPRVIFDRRSDRWFAIALEFGISTGSDSKDNNILLAVCRTNNPSTGTWDKYVIPVGVPDSGSTTFFTDFDTFGIDDNGVYFGMRIFPSFGSSRAKIAATGKASLIANPPSLGTVYQWDNITDMFSTPQPAYNFDAVGSSGRAWFVSSSTAFFANVRYRTLTWSGGVPTLSGVSILTTPGYGMPLDAQANGSSTSIDVGDDRLQMAVIRNNRLWTCRTVGVNSSGGGSGADRAGCEWLELNVSSATASLVQSGRIYDSAASDPRFYYYPSIMVSGQGHAVIGFSGSKSTEYIGAYTCGRLSSDPAGTMGSITTIKSGEAPYERLDNSFRNRWGDYSYTSLDPNDDMTIWTIQEYAESVAANIWGTWTAQLLAPAPTLSNPNGSGSQGQTGVSLALTGTGFYDPGAGFANRLDVQLTGGTINGISNYNVTYNSPTSVNVTFDISATASTGGRNVVLTNPDGQSVTVTNGFTVKGGGGGTFVELTSFTATPGNRLVELSWETAIEIDSAGFNILRSEFKDGSYVMVNEKLIPSRGGPADGAIYAYDDYEVSNDVTYYYKLQDVEFDGDINLHGPVWATPGLIRLVFPSNDSLIPALPSPTFRWSTEFARNFRIEISSDEDIKSPSPIRVHIPKHSNRYTLPRRHWKRAVKLARANNNSLYYRIVGRNSKRSVDVASHANRFTIQPSQLSLVSPSDGATRNSSLPLQFLWRGKGVERFVVEVCTNEYFSRRGTVHIKPRHNENSVRVSERVFHRILALAAENRGILYWRVKGQEFGTGNTIFSDEVRQLNILAR